MFLKRPDNPSASTIIQWYILGLIINFVINLSYFIGFSVILHYISGDTRSIEESLIWSLIFVGALGYTWYVEYQKNKRRKVEKELIERVHRETKEFFDQIDREISRKHQSIDSDESIDSKNNGDAEVDASKKEKN